MSTAPAARLAAIRAHGAELRLLDEPSPEVALAAWRDAEISGRLFLSPYSALSIIAGQDTTGRERLDPAPDLRVVRG